MTGIITTRANRGGLWRTRRGVAALEFAMIAPLLAGMLLAAFDGARALIAWQQVNNAAQAIAEAAEKLSVTPGTTSTALTWSQMQDAMTTIYAEMPGLSLGNNNGVFTGQFSVTLSEMVFCPTQKATGYTNVAWCPVNLTAGPQRPFTLWSTFLQEGGGQLITKQPPTLYRSACGVSPTQVQVWSNSIPRLSQMLDPTHGYSNPFPMSPQVVADVSYVFKPSFAEILPGIPSITFTATAVLSTPLGDTTQPILYTPAVGDANIINCQPGSIS